MTKRKTSKMEIEFDYGEDPEWDLLNVTPMRETSNRKYCSNVWEYFGQLMRSTTCLDSKNFYCLPCFQNHKLKQYSSSTATSNFYTHLRVFHNITPERGVKKRKNLTISPRVGSANPTTTTTTNTSAVTITTNVQDIKNTEHLNDLISDDDPLSEMLVVRSSNSINNNIDTKKLKESPADQSIESFVEVTQPSYKLKTKNLTRKEKEQLQQQQKSYSVDILPVKSSTSTTQLQIVEAVNADDYDKLFILSLVKEFRKVSDDYRLDAKSDLLGVLRKYQQLSTRANPNHNYSYVSDRIENQTINTEYETQNLQY